MMKTLNRSWSLILLVTLLLLTAGCGGGNSNVNTTPDDSVNISPDEIVIELDRITNRTVSINPTYQTLYKYVHQKGEKQSLLGLRDSEGLPETITGADYTDTDGNEYAISYEDNGLPGTITDKNGTSIKLNYNFEPSSKTSRPFDPTEGTTTKIRNIEATISYASEGENVTVNTSYTPDKNIFIKRINRDRTPSGNVSLTISKCGSLFDPVGSVEVLEGQQNSSLLSSYRAQRVSKGRYVSLIPQRQAISKSTQQMCESVADAVSTMCNIYNPNVSGAVSVTLLNNPATYGALCTSLASAAASGAVIGGVTAPASPAAFAAVEGSCLALFTGGLVTCNTIFAKDGIPFISRYNIPDPDRNNVAQKYLCPNVEGLVGFFGDAINDILAPSGDFDRTMKGVAYFNGIEATFSEQVDFKLDDEIFPNLGIDSTTTFLESFSTTPSKPESGQPYSAKANLSCVNNKELAVLVNRDGMPLTTNSILSTSTNNSISVSVPATPKGDVDIFNISSSDMVTNELFRITRIVKLKTNNDAPIAQDQSIRTQQDTNANITLSATDLDGDDLTFDIIKRPQNGILSGSLPNLIYVPNTGYFGDDSFTFQASDGEDDSEIATVSITVRPSIETLSWKSPIGCNRSGDFGQKWSIELIKSGNDVTGNIYFHACPGGGQLSYRLTGIAPTDGNVYTLDGVKTSSAGPLTATGPQTQQFTLEVNGLPSPNFAP